MDWGETKYRRHPTAAGNSKQICGQSVCLSVIIDTTGYSVSLRHQFQSHLLSSQQFWRVGSHDRHFQSCQISTKSDQKLGCYRWLKIIILH